MAYDENRYYLNVSEMELRLLIQSAKLIVNYRPFHDAALIQNTLDDEGRELLLTNRATLKRTYIRLLGLLLFQEDNDMESEH